MLAEDVTARLEATVPDLAGRIEGAVSLAQLIKSGALPPVTPAAHVLLMGSRGGAPSACTGLFVQPVECLVGVVLTVRSYDRTGQGAVDPVEALAADVIDALAGWSPDEHAASPFRLVRSGVVSMEGGAVVFQIEFALSTHLRIIPT